MDNVDMKSLKQVLASATEQRKDKENQISMLNERIRYLKHENDQVFTTTRPSNTTIAPSKN